MINEAGELCQDLEEEKGKREKLEKRMGEFFDLLFLFS
jgi:hypothetical protein